MAVSSKRAEYVGLVSLFLSVLFFFIAFLLGYWSSIFAVYAMSWLIGSAVLIWLVLVIHFHQRALAEQEKLDMSQLSKKLDSETIFHTKGERAHMFAVAQRRLVLLEKWFLPIFSVIIAAYQAGIGLYLLKVLSGMIGLPSKQPLICAVSMIAISFVSFLFSRYATGMSSEEQWRPLKAGGSIFIGVSILSFALAIGLAMAYFNYWIVVSVINWVVPILLMVLGLETALNVVLDIYRPRIKGQYSRAAFESKLLGIINEPGGILYTAASAIDYQFGFKVSQTWFYKLLEKAIVPLILFAAAALYFLSCIVVIGPDEQAIVEHFGNPIKASAKVKIYQPGLSFKWPWPIDKVYKYPAKRVMELTIGYKHKIDPKTGMPERGPKLWGVQHYEEEYKLLVASRQSTEKMSADDVPVSLVIAAIPVQYHVKDLNSFLYNYGVYEKDDGSTGYESERMLEAICYEKLTRFAAGSTIEVDTEADLAHSLLGAGRLEAKKILTEQMQTAADQAGLGVEIVFVGLQGIHPPPEVAVDYQQVVGAIQKKQALILGAQAKSNKTLSTLAGSLENSEKIYGLAAEYQQAREQQDSARAAEIAEQLDESFAAASGDIFKTLREAQSYAYEKAVIARGNGERFAGQIQAYNAAPAIYIHEQRLQAYEEALKDIRKYVIIADSDQYHTEIIDLTEKLMMGLPDVTGMEGSTGK